MTAALDRTLFRLAGPDAARYLNGQLTNDVAALTPGTSLAACITNHKGKLDAAPVYVHRLKQPADTFLVDAPPGLREPLLARIDRYLIADDCTLDDVSDAFTVLHSLAPTDTPAGTVHTATSIRFSTTGCDHIVPTTSAFPDPPSSFELARVRTGIPAWGAELTAGTLPPEAGLDTFAISYAKGCYIGQEVISRIRSVGRVNRRLHHILGATQEIQPGTALVKTDATDKPAGTVTSVATDPTSNTTFALAYIDTRSTAPGEKLHPLIAEKILSSTVEIGNTAPDFPAS